MKTVIIGLGNQEKRYKSVGKDCAATVDPINKDRLQTIKDAQSAFMICNCFCTRKS